MFDVFTTRGDDEDMAISTKKEERVQTKRTMKGATKVSRSKYGQLASQYAARKHATQEHAGHKMKRPSSGRCCAKTDQTRVRREITVQKKKPQHSNGRFVRQSQSGGAKQKTRVTTRWCQSPWHGVVERSLVKPCRACLLAESRVWCHMVVVSLARNSRALVRQEPMSRRRGLWVKSAKLPSMTMAKTHSGKVIQQMSGTWSHGLECWGHDPE